MIGLALFPLVGYLFLLAAFQLRRQPTPLSGEQDFLLLSCGLFGLITLGPGRLLIPLSLMSYWGFGIWFFWTMFYFLVVALTMRFRSRQRIVIYHCPMQVFIPKLVELGKELDAGVRFDGNVLTMRGLGVQCIIDGDDRGGHIELKEIGAYQDRLRWQIFQQGVNSLCRTIHAPPPGNALLLLAAGSIFAVYGILILFSELKELIVEYWLP